MSLAQEGKCGGRDYSGLGHKEKDDEDPEESNNQLASACKKRETSNDESFEGDRCDACING